MSGKTLLIAAALAVLALPVQAQQKVKIGYVNTFSGPNAVIGNEQRDAFELALDQLGRKMGGLEVEVTYADDQQKPDVGKQVTEKLIQSNAVHFLTGYIWSNVLLASVKTAVDAETFLISGNAGPSQIAGEQCSPWFFSISWQGDQTSMALGEALNQRAVKKLFIIAPNYAAGKDVAEGVKRTYKGEVVGQEMTRWPEQLDFAVELSKLRSANSEAAFVFYPGAAGRQFFQQYAQSGLKEKTTLYSVFSVDSLNLPQIGDSAVGSLSTQSWVADLDNPVNKKFVADFRAKHQRTPSFYAAQAYDSVMMINAAVAAAGGNLANKEAMRQAMRKADFPNTRGKIRFGNNHFPIQNFYLQEVVKDARGEYGLKGLSVALKDSQDPYHDKCTMKW
ncbi:MAG: ABC transporter substrate-binding protein [Rhodospirillales bacterium]|nr:ABC transporter substrate-binding protein [Rhodospirillales bacterium]